jgi:multidrug resistance efflux pump
VACLSIKWSDQMTYTHDLPPLPVTDATGATIGPVLAEWIRDQQRAAIFPYKIEAERWRTLAITNGERYERERAKAEVAEAECERLKAEVDRRAAIGGELIAARRERDEATAALLNAQQCAIDRGNRLLEVTADRDSLKKILLLARLAIGDTHVGKSLDIALGKKP